MINILSSITMTTHIWPGCNISILPLGGLESGASSDLHLNLLDRKIVDN